MVVFCAVSAGDIFSDEAKAHELTGICPLTFYHGKSTYMTSQPSLSKSVSEGRRVHSKSCFSRQVLLLLGHPCTSLTFTMYTVAYNQTDA